MTCHGNPSPSYNNEFRDGSLKYESTDSVYLFFNALGQNNLDYLNQLTPITGIVIYTSKFESKLYLSWNYAFPTVPQRITQSESILRDKLTWRSLTDTESSLNPHDTTYYVTFHPVAIPVGPYNGEDLACWILKGAVKQEVLKTQFTNPPTPQCYMCICKIMFEPGRPQQNKPQSW
jgi:hypothetical protein